MSAFISSTGSSLTRFMMKSAWPLFEFRNPHYYLAMNARWWGFRLTPGGYEDRGALSYNSFGSFTIGAPDLVGSRAYCLPLQFDDEPVNEDPEFWGFGGHIQVTTPKAGHTRLRAGYDAFRQPGELHVQFDLYDGSPSFDLCLHAAGFSHEAYLRFLIYGQYLFAPWRDGPCAAGFYSQQAQTGLMLRSQTPGGVTVREESNRVVLALNLYREEPLRVSCTVCAEEPHPDHAPAPDPAIELQSAPKGEPTEDLPSWEQRKMQHYGWQPDRSGARARVAGLFVSTPAWGHKSSRDPNTNITHVHQHFLPKVIDTGVFQAIGLSRDGIYEHGLQQEWRQLVADTHRAGLTAYMKPGDQELERLQDDSARRRWVQDNFDVRDDERCSIVRLCWESILRAWSTADIALEPKYLPSDTINALRNRTWPEAEQIIVNEITDRFSFFIDHIRALAPDTIIDLECGDTRVFRALMDRHERLGVQYMCYGQPPHVTDYLDLYYNLARHGLGAGRVVLETDSYYTPDIHELDLLLSVPPEEIYHEEALRLIRCKQRAMLAIGADAAWSWGLNLNDYPAKFNAVCFPETDENLEAKAAILQTTTPKGYL